MKLAASREQFTDAVVQAAHGVPSRPAQPLHAGILLTAGDKTTLVSGDGDVLFTVSLDAETANPGEVVLPGVLLSQMVKYLTGPQVTLETDGGRVLLSAGRTSFTLAAVEGRLYPSWKKLPELAVTVDAAELKAAVAMTVKAASEVHPVMSAVAVSVREGTLWLAATDEWCLAACGMTAAVTCDHFDVQALVAAPVLKRLSPALGGEVVRAGWDDTVLTLAWQQVSVTTRQMAGVFRPWRQMLPGEGLAWVSTDARELTRAVRMALLTEPAGGTVGMRLTGDAIIITGLGERGSCGEQVEAVYAGPEMTLLLGGRMLLEGIAGCGDAVQMAATGELRPLYLRGDAHPGFTWLIQPRRESW